MLKTIEKHKIMNNEHQYHKQGFVSFDSKIKNNKSRTKSLFQNDSLSFLSLCFLVIIITLAFTTSIDIEKHDYHKEYERITKSKYELLNNYNINDISLNNPYYVHMKAHFNANDMSYSKPKGNFTKVSKNEFKHKNSIIKIHNMNDLMQQFNTELTFLKNDYQQQLIERYKKYITDLTLNKDDQYKNAVKIAQEELIEKEELLKEINTRIKDIELHNYKNDDSNGSQMKFISGLNSITLLPVKYNLIDNVQTSFSSDYDEHIVALNNAKNQIIKESDDAINGGRLIENTSNLDAVNGSQLAALGIRQENKTDFFGLSLEDLNKQKEEVQNTINFLKISSLTNDEINEKSALANRLLNFINYELNTTGYLNNSYLKIEFNSQHQYFYKLFFHNKEDNNETYQIFIPEHLFKQENIYEYLIHDISTKLPEEDLLKYMMNDNNKIKDETRSWTLQFH